MYAKIVEYFEGADGFSQIRENHIDHGVLRSKYRLLTYHTWFEEMAKELADLEVKDQELAEACAEVTGLYKDLENASPLRIV